MVTAAVFVEANTRNAESVRFVLVSIPASSSKDSQHLVRDLLLGRRKKNEQRNRCAVCEARFGGLGRSYVIIRCISRALRAAAVRKRQPAMYSHRCTGLAGSKSGLAQTSRAAHHCAITRKHGSPRVVAADALGDHRKTIESRRRPAITPTQQVRSYLVALHPELLCCLLERELRRLRIGRSASRASAPTTSARSRLRDISRGALRVRARHLWGALVDLRVCCRSATSRRS